MNARLKRVATSKTARLKPRATSADATTTSASAFDTKDVARGFSRAKHVASIMRTLAREITGLDLPAVEKISEESQQEPFEVLIATMLSAQTRDAVTAAASDRLFKVARTPQAMAKLTTAQIQKLIFPVSFYRHKA